jgi:hypothetical protein
VTDEYGHVKISRKAYATDPWWKEPREFSKWEAWEDCIQMAAFGPYTRRVGDTHVMLKRGEFAASVRFLSQRWRWSKSKVGRWLLDARTLSRLRLREGDSKRDTKRDTSDPVYVIVNYAQYQDTPRAGGTGNGTPSGTNKKAVKEGSNTILAELVAKGLERWKAEMGGTLNFGRVHKAWKALLEDYTPAEILARWEVYFAKNQRAEDRRYLSPEHFASRIALFGEPTEQEMTDDFGQMRLHRKDRDSGQWVVA